MSLLTGWLPLTVELLAIVLIAVAIARRTRRWWLIWIPVCVGVGLLSVLIAVRTEHAEGLASDPPPAQLWWWVGLSGFAVAVLVVGMRPTQMWRRGVAVLAVIAALAATGVSLNQWVGYFTTVQEAWSQLTAGPLPNQVAVSDLGRLRGSGQQMTEGKVVAISTPKDISGFTHRTEYVYLPPLWFDGTAPPKLPVLMMIGGEFNTPADSIRTGNAISTVDAYARTHAGAAPIPVFPDVGGSFNNDTECVDGPRGNVTTHLVDEVRPYVVSHFDADSSAANRGVVGWSMGGTCAVDLTVMHPEDFATFEDIAGDIGPNAGTPQQTVDRLFGGNTPPTTPSIRSRSWPATAATSASPDGSTRATRSLGMDMRDRMADNGIHLEGGGTATVSAVGATVAIPARSCPRPAPCVRTPSGSASSARSRCNRAGTPGNSRSPPSAMPWGG